MSRGFFAIGLFQPQRDENVGTLWRSASCFGADFIFTVGKKIPKQAADTMKSWRHIPAFNFPTLDDFFNHIPEGAEVIAVDNRTGVKEVRSLPGFTHPERALYLLGNEKRGLTDQALERARHIVEIPSDCLNVASAGTVILYDRVAKKVYLK